jgi:hypothetical protein
LREKPIAEIAKDRGIAESGLRRWMAQADIDEDKKEGLSSDVKAELSGCGGRTVFRLVRELAADGFPIAVACRVLDVSTSGYYELVSCSPVAVCRLPVESLGRRLTKEASGDVRTSVTERTCRNACSDVNAPRADLARRLLPGRARRA